MSLLAAAPSLERVDETRPYCRVVKAGRTVTRRLWVSIFAVCVTGGGGAADASAALAPCREERSPCAQLTVPLDRSGAVAGTVRLRLDWRRADQATDPPLVALGAKLGQATIGHWDVDHIASALTPVVEGPDRIGVGPLRRDVILMDVRGTGRSQPLRCKALERAVWRGSSTTHEAAACAEKLGPSRGLYTSRDSAEDLESLRRALGAEKIALLGSFYGARVALAYAQRYPDRVDRLLLQSPPSPTGEDLLLRSRFAAIPQVVRARCARGACGAASQTPVADVVALARRLERAPMSGPVVDRSGRTHRERFDASDLYAAMGGESVPLAGEDGLDAIGPVRNARHGDLAPLLRVRQLSRWYGAPALAAGPRYFSAGAYAASMCEEADLPWPRTAPLEDRLMHASALVNGLPSSVFHPFGPRSALSSDLVELCLGWPVASSAQDPPRTLPAIPTLVLAAPQDILAPTADAEAVARLIPGARLLRTPGAGVELDLQLGSCVPAALGAFFAGRSPPTGCRRPIFGRAAPPAPPRSLAEVDERRGLRGRPGQTLRAVQLTLRDGAETLQAKFFARLLSGPVSYRGAARVLARGVVAGALRNGVYSLDRTGAFALRRAVYVPGVEVTGAIAAPDGDTRSELGMVRVSGPAAAHGNLTLRGRLVSGRLGGRLVRATLGPATYPDISFGR